MPVSLTYLRSHIYEVVDEVIETGQPVEIERHGKRVLLVAEPRRNRLDYLKKRDDIVLGDSEDLVHMDWSSEWDEEKNL